MKCALLLTWTLLALIGTGETYLASKEPASSRRKAPELVAHRGLLRDAPENTLVAFAACLKLRMGFEVDVRRSQDGQLVCIHDESVQRTTNGKGKVTQFSLAKLKKLDAGKWFDTVYAGERVPTLEEVFALLSKHRSTPVRVALDLKIEDPNLEKDIVRLANKHKVLSHVICIGRTINNVSVRRKLRQADANTPIAVLANVPGDLAGALRDRYATWIYVRFIPSPEQTNRIHRMGKRVFLVGSTVSGLSPDNWRRARTSGVDALLTDYPLECRRVWRTPTKKKP